MTRIGVTGHMNLTPETVGLVDKALRSVLETYARAGLTGVSCIAAGSDTIFAEAVLDLGGDLEVILPASDYRERKVKPDHAERFDALIQRATRVRVMAHSESNRAAYEDANEAMLSSCDLLIAVWDGQAAVDKGGTAAVVEEARVRGLSIEVIWPAGASRSS